ncbi:MAG: segregation/condensation protein A [Candidatus Omnitrophica bacterium]|nr:segregation/condensation protein A [Candidatus Omnitrophota bacterium]
MSYKVKLEIFEGPLDLLLYLVKQNHLEIDSIPIATLTEQYLQYLELMQALDLEVAGEFLVVAATLMQIKSRMLLPPEALPPPEEEQPDPAQELLERLKEYQKFKQAAEALSGMEKERLVQYSRPVVREGVPVETEEYLEASLFDLLTAFSQFMSGEVSRDMIHEIIREEFTVEQQVELLRRLTQERKEVRFTDLFGRARTKLEAIATFLALLELIRLKNVVILQGQLFGEILVMAREEENADGRGTEANS